MARRLPGGSSRPNGRSVQQAVEEAIGALRRPGGADSLRRPHRRRRSCHPSGRACRPRQAIGGPTRFATPTNAHLRAGSCRDPLGGVVPETFSARLSARQAPLSLPHPQPPRAAGPRGRIASGMCPWALDAAVMHEAAQTLIGRHDFTTFRAAECQANSPIRTLDRLDVERIGDEIRIQASARSFLHHQVRSIVGTLAKAGAGRWTVADVARGARGQGPQALWSDGAARPGSIWLASITARPIRALLIRADRSWPASPGRSRG